MKTLPNKDYALQQLNKYTIKNSETGCWLWQGYVTDRGYGQYTIEAQKYSIHRLSLYLFKNFDLNSKLLACHTNNCSNKHCWNPEHLYAGTISQNTVDSINTGKHYNSRKTHCKYGHLYNESNTSIIDNKRYCKVCHAIREALRVKKLKELNNKGVK